MTSHENTLYSVYMRSSHDGISPNVPLCVYKLELISRWWWSGNETVLTPWSDTPQAHDTPFLVRRLSPGYKVVLEPDQWAGNGTVHCSKNDIFNLIGLLITLYTASFIPRLSPYCNRRKARWGLRTRLVQCICYLHEPFLQATKLLSSVKLLLLCVTVSCRNRKLFCHVLRLHHCI